MKRKLFFYLIAATAFAGCTNDDGKKRKAATENIYFDYQVRGEEDRDNVTCLLRYRLNGPEGTAILLGGRGKVELDGEELVPDSAGLSGFYYELDRPLSEFSGRHTIVFTGKDKKQYREEFDFRPFDLAGLPAQVTSPFVLRLEGLGPDTVKVHLILIDTVFDNNDVHEIIPAANGEVPVTSRMLERLKGGPISMELYTEEERPLRQRPKGGGRIVISYSLKRDFELAN